MRGFLLLVSLLLGVRLISKYARLGNEASLRRLEGPGVGHPVRLHDIPAADVDPHGSVANESRPITVTDFDSDDSSRQERHNYCPTREHLVHDHDSQGQYDGSGLASAIQTKLIAAAPGTWTVSYDVANISMKIQCSNNFTITGGTYAAQLMSRAYTQTANSYSFSYVSVIGEDVIFLCSPNFNSLDNLGPSGSHDMLLCCNVTAPFGSIQEFNMPYDVWRTCPAMTISQLSFQLRDRSYGLMTNFVPNVSFLLTIDD